MKGSWRFLLLLFLPACNLDEALEVRLPGRVPEEALDRPELALTLARGVVADLECAWDNYVAGAAILSDEYIQSSGNLLQRNWGTRRVPADDGNMAQGLCEEDAYGIYTPLQVARSQAERVYERLAAFTDAEVPNRVSLQASVRA